MYHSLVSWMMADGLDGWTHEDLRQREQYAALREAHAVRARGSVLDGLRARVAGLRSTVAPTTPALDCCAA